MSQYENSTISSGFSSQNFSIESDSRTLTYEAKQTGVPLVRPLFFDFAASDPNVYQIHDQVPGTILI